MTIRQRMILSIAVPTIAIYLVILGATMVVLHRQSRRAVERESTRVAALLARRIEDRMGEIAAAAEATAASLEERDIADEAPLYAQLRRLLERFPSLYGACLAFEPGVARAGTALVAPYVYRGAGGLVELNIDESVYDWYRDPRWTWFRVPRETGKSAWSEPYFDENAGNILMCTYSAVFRRDGRFAGVATADVDLEFIHSSIAGDISGGVDFVVLTRGGHFVYAPRAERIMRQTIHEAARESGREDLAELAHRILAPTTGFVEVNGWDTPQRQWVFHAPIPSPGWVLAYRVPADVVLHDLHRRMLIGGIGLAATLLLIVVAIVLASRRIARPVGRLTARVREVARGRLDASIDRIEGSDEIAQLARSFNAMTADLRGHVERLATEQAARQRIERDLDIAREIQRGLWPMHPPDSTEFDVAGWSRPADKTGGDYYDWQKLPDGRIAVSLADATGHGIGAALMSAVCRAYARGRFLTGDEVHDLLARVNALLVDDLTGGRFVTFVVAVLDERTGRAQLLSAGHGPILYYRADGGEVTALPTHGLPLGVTNDVPYGEPTMLEFHAGDALVLLTDGVFEWANGEGEAFGLERLNRAVGATAGLPSAEVIHAVDAAVRDFVGEAPQEDDVTIVVVRRRGAAPH